MSLEDINSFCLKSIKSEIEYKERICNKNKSKYSNYNCKKVVKKLNPKLKLPPIEIVPCDELPEEFDLDSKFSEIKNDISDLKKLFEDSEQESSYAGDSRTSLLSESKSKLELAKNETISSPLPYIIEKNTKSESVPTISSIVENIIELEDKLKETFVEFDQIRQDRFKNEHEICMEIQTLNKCPFEKRNSQKFLKICQYKKTKQSIQTRAKFIANPVKIIKADNHKSQEKFKSKNTQLSKNTDMSTLTDEEKARIKELLSDMDENGEDIVPSYKGDIEKGDQSHKVEEKNTNRAFVFDDSDKNKIEDIEDKLSMYEETKEKRENPDSSDQSYDQIDWKDINDLTITEIDEALEKLRLRDNTEKTSNISQITLPQRETTKANEEEVTKEIA